MAASWAAVQPSPSWSTEEYGVGVAVAVGVSVVCLGSNRGRPVTGLQGDGKGDKCDQGGRGQPLDDRRAGILASSGGAGAIRGD